MEPKKFYSETAGFYDVRHESPTTKRVRSLERRAVERFTHGLVLDAGCGTGAWLDRASIGIDFSGEMLKAAVRGRPLVQGSVEALPFENHAFDTVMCMFSVLNLCDPGKAVAEFSRTLKTGGCAIVSVASIWDKGYSLREKMKLSRSDPDGRLVRTGKSKRFCVLGRRLNIRLLEKQELVELFERNGFVMERFDSAFIWQKPVWNDLRPFGLAGRIRLVLERALPHKDFGCYYVMVFRKAW